MDSLGDKLKECETPTTIPGRARPRLINMSCAQNVVISGITIMNGASWNVHMIYSDNIVTYGCTFKFEAVWNGDGWDPDSSTNCTLFGCNFYTGDDAVAIKSGKNPEGNIHISYSSVYRILMHSVGYNYDGEPAPTAPIFEHCSFENMEVTAVMYGKDEQDKYCEAIEVSGFDEPGHFARNIKLKTLLLTMVKKAKNNQYIFSAATA